MAVFEGEDIFVPGSQIPDSSVVPDGTYELRIEEIHVTKSRERGLLMVTPVLTIIAGPYQDMTLNLGPMVLGTAEDPSAKDPLTWTHPQQKKAFGIIRWGKLLRAIDLKLDGMLRELCVRAEGRQLMAIVKVQTDTDPQSPYYLSQKNVIPDNGYFKLGERTGGNTIGRAVPGQNGPPLDDTPLPQVRQSLNTMSGGLENQESRDNTEIPF